MAHLQVELYLPLHDNDGNDFDEVPFLATARELVAQFGGATQRETTFSGIWRFQGQEYHDRLRSVFTVVEDLAGNREFFRDYKEKLKERFRQLDILILATPVERL